jgi:hypothetical protein
MKQLISMIIFYLFSLNANLIKLSDFIRHTKYESVKASPGGKQLAGKKTFDAYKILVFWDFKTKALKHLLGLSKKRNLGGYYWINNERVVLDVTHSYGPLDHKYLVE